MYATVPTNLSYCELIMTKYDHDKLIKKMLIKFV